MKCCHTKKLSYFCLTASELDYKCEIVINGENLEFSDSEGVNFCKLAPDYIALLNDYDFTRWKERYEEDYRYKLTPPNIAKPWEIKFSYGYTDGVITGDGCYPTGWHSLLNLIRFIHDCQCEIPVVSKALDSKMTLFIKESIMLLRVIANDKAISDWCKNESTQHKYLFQTLYDLFYSNKWFEIVTLANSIRQRCDRLDKNTVFYPTEETAGELFKAELITCIISEVSSDHICEGSLLTCIGEGYLLTLFEAYLKAKNLY